MRYRDLGLHTEENRMSASLVLASRLEEVTAFMNYLLKVLTANEFAANELFAIQLAVEEALVNAAKHGNRMDPRKQIHLRFAVRANGFQIQIRDEGQGFDPNRVPNPEDPLYRERPRGRGLWLLRNYMHEVQFNAKGNRVTLIRRRSPT